MESENKLYSSIKQIARTGRSHPFCRGLIEMITSAFSILFIVNDLADWIAFPNWKYWLLGILVVFFVTMFFHIIEKNLRIDDLENEQPNLDIKIIKTELQTPTMFNSKTDELSKTTLDFDSSGLEYYPSSDAPSSFGMSKEIKDMDTKKGEEGERVFALITNYPKSKEVIGVKAINVTANITFLDNKGEILHDTSDKIRWESTPSPTTRGVREQTINSVDINCGETKKLYFMTHKSDDGSLYIHNDDSYKSGGWYLESQKISSTNFFVKIELFAEKFVSKTFFYKFNPSCEPEMFSICSYEDIYY